MTALNPTSLIALFANFWNDGWPHATATKQASPKQQVAAEKPSPHVVTNVTPRESLLLAETLVVDFSAAGRENRSAKLNAWAKALLIGAKGTRYSSFGIDDVPNEPLFKWVTPTGEVYYEDFTSTADRPFALVLYRDYGPDKTLELVQESM